MRILGIVAAALIFLFGFRMIIIALRTALSGKILIRQGVRSKWQSAPTINDAWKVALRDGIMGLLLVALGVAMIT